MENIVAYLESDNDPAILKRMSDLADSVSRMKDFGKKNGLLLDLPNALKCHDEKAPKNFVEGFEAAVDRVAYFYHIAEWENAADDHYAVLDRKLRTAIKSATTRFQSNDTASFDFALDISARMRKSTLAEELKYVDWMIRKQAEQVANTDLAAFEVAEKPFLDKLAKLESDRKAFLESGILPPGMVISELFKDSHVSQFHFEETIIRGRMDNVRRGYKEAVRQLESLNVERKNIIAEIETLNKPVENVGDRLRRVATGPHAAEMARIRDMVDDNPFDLFGEKGENA